MEKININLSPDSIKTVINTLKTIRNNLKKLDVEINDSLSQQLLDEIKNNYETIDTGLGGDIPHFYIDKHNKTYKIIASSSSIVYEEFGTGDVGQSHPHPNKNKYGLHPYNYHTLSSGRGTIRPVDSYAIQRGVTKGMYWTYQGNITQGIPAGKFMYNSSEWLKKNYKTVVKKKVGEALSKH